MPTFWFHIHITPAEQLKRTDLAVVVRPDEHGVKRAWKGAYTNRDSGEFKSMNNSLTTELSQRLRTLDHVLGATVLGFRPGPGCSVICDFQAVMNASAFTSVSELQQLLNSTGE